MQHSAGHCPDEERDNKRMLASHAMAAAAAADETRRHDTAGRTSGVVMPVSTMLLVPWLLVRPLR